MTPRRIIRLLTVILLSFTFLTFIPLGLRATAQVPTNTPTFQPALVVNTLSDVNDGVCNATHCSLREAIAQISYFGTITFSVTGTINVTQPLNVTRPMTITGYSTPSSLVLNGGNLTQIMIISPGDVTISGLTFYQGSAVNGGAISNSGALTVDNCVFNANRIGAAGSSGRGSGIYQQNTASKLAIKNSTFTNNTIPNSANAGVVAYDPGGATPTMDISISNSTFTNNRGGSLYVTSGRISVTGSTFDNNVAVDMSSLANDIVAGGYSIDLTVSNSTFNKTRPESNGDAIWVNAGFNVTALIQNSTFVGNVSGASSAIANEGAAVTLANSTVQGGWGAGSITNGTLGSGGSLTILNSTIQGNNVNYPNAAGVRSPGGTVTLKNSIVSENLIGNCSTTHYNGSTYTSYGGQITDGGNNLQYGNATCSANIPVSNPLLGVLANNGGTTKTMALQAGSPAIDAGNNMVCAGSPINNKDQRGVTRLIDGNGDGIASCDIGAYEAPATATPTPTATSTATATVAIPTNTPTATDTATDTPTDIPTNTLTDTPTDTPTDTATATDTATNTATDTATSTPTSTLTPSPTRTSTPTITPTVPTATRTPTRTPTKKKH